MDDIYKLYCKILENETKMKELVPRNDGIILKMYKNIIYIQYETLRNLLKAETKRICDKQEDLCDNFGNKK